MADVIVHWGRMTRDDDERWDWSRVLYGLVTPPCDRIFYLGKADYCSVRERCGYAAKRELWGRVDRYALIAGDVELPRGARLSAELLSDVESLLIFNVQPRGNRACRRFRISRPGLSVECVGAWPFRRRRFYDE